ncbi:unnamed protein product [Agarophyton chilense]
MTLFATDTHASTPDDVLPPIRTEVTFRDDNEQKNDDPSKAWEEWGETEETRKNPFPRRQRKIEMGMDINTIMGMAMKQPKVLTAVLTPQYGSEEKTGQIVTQKFRNQLAAAGIGCRLWFVPQGRQVIANCETIRDGHMAKDYMISQPEIMRTVIDNVPFTPKPTPSDDDDDDDDDDDGDHSDAKDQHQAVTDMEEKPEL